VSRRNPGSLVANRKVMAQINICNDCCCGRSDTGHRQAVDWLKARCERSFPQKKIHLSISGCLGHCDQSNVVRIVTLEWSLWLGGIERHDQYRQLMDWASACDRAGVLQPLPHSLGQLECQRFQCGRFSSRRGRLNHG
jgi:hypothetical protein